MLIVFVMLVVLLTSCASSAMSGLYVLSLSYAKAATAAQSTPRLEVRVGYFSLCVQSAGSWLCSGDTTSLIQQFATGGNDPRGIVPLATLFKNGVLFCGMMYDAPSSHAT